MNSTVRGPRHRRRWGTELKAHAKDAERAFMQLSRSANSPGVPGIILIVIVLLGMVLSGVMAAAPRSARPSRRRPSRWTG